MMLEDEIGEYFTDCEAQPLVCSCLLAGCSFCDHFGDLACLSGVETLPAPEPTELAAYPPTHRRMQGKAADVCELTAYLEAHNRTRISLTTKLATVSGRARLQKAIPPPARTVFDTEPKLTPER